MGGDRVNAEIVAVIVGAMGFCLVPRAIAHEAGLTIHSQAHSVGGWAKVWPPYGGEMVEDSYGDNAETPVNGNAHAYYQDPYWGWSWQASAESFAGTFEVGARARAEDSAGAESFAQSTYDFTIIGPDVQLAIYGSYSSQYGHSCSSGFSLWDTTLGVLIDEQSWYAGAPDYENGTIAYQSEYSFDVTHWYRLTMGATSRGSAMDGASCATLLGANLTVSPEPSGVLLVALGLFVVRRR